MPGRDPTNSEKHSLHSWSPALIRTVLWKQAVIPQQYSIIKQMAISGRPTINEYIAATGADSVSMCI